MQVKDIQDYLRKEPFRSFRLMLDDGRAIAITHSEAVALTPGGRSIVVMHPDESTDRIDVLHIVSIDERVPRNGKGKSAGGRHSRN